MVTFVGAGPGAADLLTLRGLERLRAADVVVHDRLVPQAVLAEVPEGVERIAVDRGDLGDSDPGGTTGVLLARLRLVVRANRRVALAPRSRDVAIEHVARLKGVKAQKADLSLICKDLSQLSLYARSVDTSAFRMMKHALPGPYTFILQASSEIPKLFKNNKRTVGIRVPDHPIPQAIVEELGHALVVTSVHDPDKVVDYTTDPERIDEHLGDQVEAVIDAGIGGLEGSTVIDLSEGAPRLIRQGKGSSDGLF
jgi:tRNA threonylcarbamoyl adenosine modification protein (Sua5/YciO/YrdC/YwlC family)